MALIVFGSLRVFIELEVVSKAFIELGVPSKALIELGALSKAFTELRTAFNDITNLGSKPLIEMGFPIRLSMSLGTL